MPINIPVQRVIRVKAGRIGCSASNQSQAVRIGQWPSGGVRHCSLPLVTLEVVNGNPTSFLVKSGPQEDEGSLCLSLKTKSSYIGNSL